MIAPVPPGNPAPGNNRIELGPERFYWALLDAPTVGAGGRLHTRLGYLFENVLPEPIEQVHAEYVRVKSSYLACGMNKARLQQIVDQHPSAGRVGPTALPEFLMEQVRDADVPLDRLNLLRGEFEPPRVRLARRRMLMYLALVVIAIGAVVVVGFERRVRDFSRQRELIVGSREHVIRDTIATAANSHQPLDMQLIAELRRLRQSRAVPSMTGTDPGDIRGEDCASILEDLLGHWPKEALMMTESVIITPTTISIRGSAPASQDVQTFATAIGQLAKKETCKQPWLLQQPLVNSTREGVQAALQLTRSGGKGGPS